MKFLITLVLALVTVFVPVSTRADEEIFKQNYTSKNASIAEINSNIQQSVSDFYDEIIALNNPTTRMKMRIIALTQTRSGEEFSKKADEVLERNAFVIFFAGPDYEKISELKIAASQSQARIDQLERIIPEVRTNNPGYNTEKLEASLAKFKSAKSDLSTFAVNQEKKFSLFGWLSKSYPKKK